MVLSEGVAVMACAKKECGAIEASGVLRLLAKRHTRDLFFSEVKDGPTCLGSHLRIDALAIAKSWSPVRLMGYEIKVSRSDWLSDQKWTEYLKLTTHFSIAAPTGVVQLEELPPGVGYVEVSSAGKSLRTIRKPAYSDISLPADLLLYLLMSRMVPGDPHRYEWTRERRMELWREKLARDRDGRLIGRAVGERLRNRIEELEHGSRFGDQPIELDRWLSERERESGAWASGSLLDRVQKVIARPTTEAERAREQLETAVAKASRALNLLARMGIGHESPEVVLSEGAHNESDR